MANPDHLAILQQSVPAWNRWRKRKVDLKPDLSEAPLRWANLGRADLRGADLRRADLGRADLSEADLRWADLRGADLRIANLSRANLGATYLNGADLRGADLSEAHVSGADFTNSDMAFGNLANLDLSHVKGLETVQHNGPSSIGIDTIFRSQGRIPEIFLRGAGVPEVFIANMRSLVAAMGPIEFYSCFISYSSKDQEFAERLHADLQAKGVRCWYAPENLRIGDKFRLEIDRAIRLHDKLLVVLSETSVASSWVEKEVETAFEKERKTENKPGLFPIRLDDAVMETSESWAADIRRTRHIGDFSNWKDHDSYQKAFARLLRDLQGVKSEAGAAS
jgi:uncharacterized protein YjbI with pentapeptide repeats